MNNKILRAFSIERGEESQVLLLLLQSFFIGVFVASYEVIACGLFVEVFGDGDTALAMVFSGMAGILLVTLYSRMQRIMSFTSLAAFNIIFCILLAIALRAAFYYTDSKWLIFVVFLMIGPFAVVLILGFWGSAGRLFTLRQGKRLNGLVDSGMIVGMILISSLMPVLQLLFNDLQDILYLSIASIVVAVIIQLAINARFKEQLNGVGEASNTEESAADKKMTWGRLFKNRFTRTFSLFVTLSMVTAFFIWLSYLNVTKGNYETPEEMTNFFAIFTAIMLTFTLVIKTTLYSRVLKTYGLKITLIAIAALIVILAGISVLVGFSFGYDPASNDPDSNFVMFFLVISLLRLFAQSLKMGIENPAQKIFFQPLDRNVRYDVQAKIEGVVNESAGIIAGALLFIIFKYLAVIHVMMILIGIVVLWMLVGVRLYNEYQNTLKSSLSNLQSGKSANYNDDKVGLVLQDNMSSATPEKVIYTLGISKSIHPVLFEDSLFSLLDDDSKQIKAYVLNQIEQGNLFWAEERLKAYIDKEADEHLKDKAIGVLAKLDEGKEQKRDYKDLMKLSRSRDALEKEFAIKLIVQLQDPRMYELINDLTRDVHPNVKFAVISAISTLRLKEYYGFIIDQLDVPKYRAAATSALIHLDADVLDLLEQSFYKSGYSAPALIRIVKIIGIIGGDKATGYLVNKITYPDRKVVNQALLSLRACDYKADETNRNRLHQIIEVYIDNVGWYYATREELDKDRVYPELMAAIEVEIEESLDLLYLLLSLAYDAQSISQVKENIENGSSESISYAIELLDLVIIEDLKPKLFPLLEDNSMSDKLNQLRVHFPREDYSSWEVLMEILNRDYNLCNRWTKACATMSILKMKDPKVTQDIVANIFNEDRMLREAAAQTVYLIDRRKYDEITQRIPQTTKSSLDKLLYSESKNKKLLFEEVLFLAQINPLSQLKGSILSEIAELLQKASFGVNEEILSKKSRGLGPLMLVKEGGLVLVRGNEELMKFGPEQVFGEMFLLESDLENVAIRTETESTIYFVSEDDLYVLIYQFPEVAEVLIGLVEKRLDRNPVSSILESK